MLLSLLLFESEFLHIVAISYTALVINELIMVALEITTWHTYMVLSGLGTAAVYFGSMTILPAYFGKLQWPCSKQLQVASELTRARHVVCPHYPVCIQGGHHCGSLEFPTLHDQSVSSPIQAGSIHQSCRDIDTVRDIDMSRITMHCSHCPSLPLICKQVMHCQ